MTKSRPVRVLILSPEYGALHVGGLGTMVSALCRALDPSRFQPVVALPRSSRSVPWELVARHDLPGCQVAIHRDAASEIWLLSSAILDGPIYPLPDQHGGAVAKFGELGERVGELLALMEIDLVHLHDWFGHECVHRARSLGIPSVLTIHRLHRDIPDYFAVQERAARLADQLTTVGRLYLRDNLDFFGQEDAVRVIHNGINLAHWSYPEADDVTHGRGDRRRLLLSALGLPDRSTFAYVGRLDADQKGLDVLIRAYTQHLVHDANNLLVIGEGDESLCRSFHDLAQSMPERVCFRNRFLPAREVREVLAAVDFAVIPSRYEPFGLIQLEAMAMGAIPIASATGGLAEANVDIEREGGFGKLFASGDAAALAAAMDGMARLHAAAPERIVSLRRRAARAVRAHDHLTMGRRYEALYGELLARQRAPGP